MSNSTFFVQTFTLLIGDKITVIFPLYLGYQIAVVPLHCIGDKVKRRLVSYMSMAPSCQIAPSLSQSNSTFFVTIFILP